MPHKPKIRIVSEGVGARTKVLDAETGEDLTAKLCVSKVVWSVEPGGVAKAELTLLNVAVDVVGEWSQRMLRPESEWFQPEPSKPEH